MGNFVDTIVVNMSIGRPFQWAGEVPNDLKVQWSTSWSDRINATPIMDIRAYIKWILHSHALVIANVLIDVPSFAMIIRSAEFAHHVKTIMPPALPVAAADWQREIDNLAPALRKVFLESTLGVKLLVYTKMLNGVPEATDAHATVLNQMVASARVVNGGITRAIF